MNAGKKGISPLAIVGWAVTALIVATIVCTGLGIVDVNGIK